MPELRSFERYVPIALAVLCIVAALIFIEHGARKLLGFPAPPAGGLPAPFSLLWVGAILEFAGGALVPIGLFTLPVAFILSGEMAVAYWMAHAPRDFYQALNGGDAAILYCFVFLYLVVAGAGAWSLDDRMRA